MNGFNTMRCMQPIKHYMCLKAGPLYGSSFLRHIILDTFYSVETAERKDGGSTAGYPAQI